MSNEKQIPLDVVVIGGGPAGISACLELSKSSGLKISVFERASELGGIPRACHIFFGMRDLKRIYRGPTYAQKLNKLILKTSVKIHTEATVLNISPGSDGEAHRITVSSANGLETYESRFVILATGCFESSRGARMIPGERCSGIFSTGTLQQMVNLRHQKPGKRALIIGSEIIALSAAITLKRVGIDIVGMIEEDLRLQTYPSAARAMSVFYRFPIYKGTTVKSIVGRERVEGVELVREKDQKMFRLQCDMLIISGKLRPDSSLIDNTAIERDPSTFGPLVDMDLMTSVPNIFAAGNILRGADMHDLCALEGKKAAQSILRRVRGTGPEPTEYISMQAEAPIRYVVPQKIARTRRDAPLFSLLSPTLAMQVERTLCEPVVEGWSGDAKIWECSCARLIGGRRYPIPLKKLDWDRVDPRAGIVLKIKPAEE